VAASGYVGVAHAAATDLHRHFGARWLWPGELGTFVPRRQRIVLPDLILWGQRASPHIPPCTMPIKEQLTLAGIAKEIGLPRFPYLYHPHAASWRTGREGEC
jgi:hypothetical protein